MTEQHQQSNKKQFIAYIIAGAAIVVALFYIFKSGKLKNRLEVSQQKEDQLNQEMESHRNLLRIDSMLVEGQYGTALRAYNEEFENKDIEDVSGVRLRIDLAEQLIKLKSGEYIGQQSLRVRDSLDSIQKQGMALPIEIRRYDSLSFAHEKSKIQMANLRRQLKNKSFGEYLTFTSSKGSQMHYVGQVSDQKANGYGVAILDTGSRYEGQWRDNQRHGEGSFYWADGEYYVGQYSNDQRNGQGTYYWPNGEKYVGQWKDDKRNGDGVFYGKDGEVITRGLWKNDKLVNEKKKV